MALQSSAAVGGYVVQIALAGVAAVVTLQVWILRWLQKLERNTGATRVTLFGETGDNGLNGTVKEHGAELRDHEKRIARLFSAMRLEDNR